MNFFQPSCLHHIVLNYAAIPQIMRWTSIKKNYGIIHKDVYAFESTNNARNYMEKWKQ